MLCYNLDMKFLVVGLGNPEGKYFNTYHNVGFVAAEGIAARLQCDFKKKGNQLIAKAGDVLVLKPITYMNLSGQAVLAVVRKHRIAPENIVVITDDLYIEKGNIRISFGGSHGGHNGIRSINELLGTNQYLKIRIGIKPEKPPHSNAQYVLSKICGDIAVEKSIQAAQEFLHGESIEKLQGRYNIKNVQNPAQ